LDAPGLFGDSILVRRFNKGDQIFVEQSGKWSPEKIERIAKESGMSMSRYWEDESGYFRLVEFLPLSVEEACGN